MTEPEKRSEERAAKLRGAKLYEWSEPPDFPGCLNIAGEECTIWLQARPGWCDRGKWLATIDCWGKLGATFDHQDGWPRYYFDEERAKAEIEEWIRVRERSLSELRTVGPIRDKVTCAGEGCGLELPRVAAWMLCAFEPTAISRNRLAAFYCTGCYLKNAPKGLEPIGPPKGDD